MNRMELHDAYTILERNYRCQENSIIYDLHENSQFSVQFFWEFYDSVMTLAQDALGKGANIQTAMKITFVYQQILKEMIFHFDEQDESRLKHFPRNYMEYIERLDDGLSAYFCGVFIDEKLYSLKR
ncbi:hypothetical protein GN277_25260 [Lachnospiraceae bacterium WCA-9-b2]|uniref:Uncharacterized protein n=2 Tax=Sporofaciens musculi TaxID=2681861 RepID=A0A7X3MLA1_9FIRM|nr:Imm41 family immunity protein [Sporofaciens musculi]MXP78528.1 hypothetical protein [Sporofaciens musculi]